MTGPTGSGGAPLTRAVLDFRPSRHGFHFANRFPPGPTIRFGPIDTRRLGFGDAAAGLCGGMALTVRDLFQRGVEPPVDREPPANGSPRFRALVRRQVQSLDWLRLPLRLYDRAAFRPDPPTWWSRLLRRRPLLDLSIARDWPQIRTEIDAGGLPVVILVRVQSANPFRLTSQHQVLGYGYRVESGSLALRVYDPNHPDRDDVELRVSLADDGRPLTIEASTGEAVRGFLVSPYTFVEPNAWRPT